MWHQKAIFTSKNISGRKIYKRKRGPNESNLAANKLNDTPEAPQEFKIHPRRGGPENRTERTKKAEKEKKIQSNCVNRKPKNNEKQAVEKEETEVEIASQSSLTPLSDDDPLINQMDIETQLVYTDEKEISFEFTTSAKSLPLIHKQLQMTLQKGSACYRQEKYAAALQQFSTALKVWGYSLITLAK